MKYGDRSIALETVDIPISVIAKSDLAENYLPLLSEIADKELKKMGDVGRDELARRKKQRAAHVKANRAFYVRSSEGYSGSITIVTRSKDRDRDEKGHLLGNSCQGPNEGVRMAQMMLALSDEGGVIYVDKLWGRKAFIVDVWPNPCEALAKTGNHDWSYVPTGDDICRSCGLVV